MAVECTGRNVEVTSSLKELAEERTQRLERHLTKGFERRVERFGVVGDVPGLTEQRVGDFERFEDRQPIGGAGVDSLQGGADRHQ